MAEIRKAVGSDAEKILECLRIIGSETDNLTFGAEGVPLTVAQEQSFLEGIDKPEKQGYLVAAETGEVIGTGSYSGSSRPRLAHRGEISVCVRKEAWGQHIGTQILEKLIDFARNTAKAEIISLEVRSDNSRAIALYQKFGFKKIGTFPGFMKIDGKDIDCDIMCMHL